MKTIKPQKVSVLHRTFEHRGRKLFVPSLLLAFPLEATDVLLHEVVLWKTVAEELDETTPLDEMMLKPRAEALLTGRAFPPGGKAAPSCGVRMKVGRVDKKLVVVGDRHWTQTGPTDPVPFKEMPLGWSQAFGGESYADNPVGLGADPVERGGKRVQPLPNVEPPGKLVTSPSDRPRPASFAALPFHWPVRQALTGTYDDVWRKTRYPGFPDDTDLALFLVAPPDQRFEGFLQGGEPFVLENLHPTQARIEGRLPTHQARCFITRSEASEGDVPALEEIKLERDTIHFFPAAGVGVLVFRGVVEVEEDDASDVFHVVAAAEAAGEPKPRSHYQQAFAARLDPEGGGFASLKDRELLPPTPDGHAPLAVEQYGDLGELLATDGLLAENQHRGASKRVEAAREACREAGLDPDELFPEPAPPPPKPDLENLDVLVEQVRQQHEEAVAESKKKKAELQAKAAEALAAAGIDEAQLTEGSGGPPTFSAEAEIERMKQRVELLRIAGSPTEELERQLDDPSWVEQLHTAEAKLRDAYRRLAQHYPPAAPNAERAQSLRAEVERSRAEGTSLAGRDLTGADLSGLDLCGVDLSQSFLEGADLTETDLSEAKLDRAVLARARLHQTRLRGASLHGTSFGAAELWDADLEGADAREAVFAKAQISRTSLAALSLDGADFYEARLEQVSFAGAKARRLLFMSIALEGADFSGSELLECVFFECQLSAARFSQATLNGTIFVGCEAKKACFDGAQANNLRAAKESDFSGASFVGAVLDHAAFRGTAFPGADFRGASLTGADLSVCDLQDAQLSRAVAPKAMLMKADLRRAACVEANFMEAVLQKANIRGTDFSRANLFRADFARIEGDQSTRFDGALRKYVRFVRQEGGMAG